VRTPALAAAVLAFGAAGEAQSPRERWESLNALTPGVEIRISLTTGKSIRGFFQKAAPDAIVVNAATSQERIARADVKRVELKRAGHRGRNTLIGLGIGTGGGLAAGLAFDARASDFLGDHFGKVAFTSFGAILGTVVGVAWPTGGWREIYRAP
jgi:hypothetical protein